MFTLPVLFVVGETFTSGVQEWCYNVAGRKKCLLLDTWWQTGKAIISICSLFSHKVASALNLIHHQNYYHLVTLLYHNFVKFTSSVFCLLVYLSFHLSGLLSVHLPVILALFPGHSQFLPCSSRENLGLALE